MTFYSFYIGEQAVTCLLIEVICGESPKVNQRRWTNVGHRQLVHPSTPLITSVERNCLHGSLWLIQPCWSTWGTRVNAPLVSSSTGPTFNPSKISSFLSCLERVLRVRWKILCKPLRCSSISRLYSSSHCLHVLSRLFSSSLGWRKLALRSHLQYWFSRVVIRSATLLSALLMF